MVIERKFCPNCLSDHNPVCITLDLNTKKKPTGKGQNQVFNKNRGLRLKWEHIDQVNFIHKIFNNMESINVCLTEEPSHQAILEGFNSLCTAISEGLTARKPPNYAPLHRWFNNACSAAYKRIIDRLNCPQVPFGGEKRLAPI